MKADTRNAGDDGTSTEESSSASKSAAEANDTNVDLVMTELHSFLVWADGQQVNANGSTTLAAMFGSAVGRQSARQPAEGQTFQI